MANTLGSLVVRLGLDAAEFTSGLTKSEYQAKKFAATLDKRIASAANAAGVAIGVITAAAIGAAVAVDKLVKQAGNFQDLAEKTGANAEALASFAVAAGTTETAMDLVAKASVKLSVGLSKVDEESKGVGAALTAIGLPLADFKNLDPAAQLEAVAKALSGFEDGAEKTAVAVALFGKAGADLLPFLKELGEGVGRVNILTAEQIRMADQYADAQARAKAELNLYAQALATEAIPAMTALASAATTLIKELLGLDDSLKELKASGAILDWAESVALGFATVIEAATGVAKAIRAIGGSIESVYADAKLIDGLVNPITRLKNAITGESVGKLLEDRNKVAAEANERYVDLWNYDGTRISTAIKKSFQEQRNLLVPENAREAAKFNRRAEDMRGPKKKVDVSGLITGKGAGGDNAAALLKKQFDAEIRAIREFAEQQRDGYEFANQYLKGVFDDGLTSLADYFEKQKALREAGLASQLQALDQEIAAWEAFRSNPALKPEQRVDAENRIADAVQKRAGIVQRAAADETLALQENAKAVKANAYAYYDYLAAVKGLSGDDAGASALRIAKQTRDAQELLTKVGFDPTSAEGQARAYGELLTKTEALSRAQNEYGRLVETASVKESAALLEAKLAGQSEIETLTRIGGIRQEALGAMSELVVKARELANALGTPEAILFADKLALQFKQAAAEAQPLLEKVREIGAEIAEGIAGQFEDALLANGKTMRERVLGLFTGISDEIQRTLTRELVTKPLKDYLTNLIGGNGSASGGGGLLAGLFGTGKGGETATNTPQEAFRLTEIASQNAATAALTASSTALSTAYTAGTSVFTALTAAAQSAAAALSTISASGGGGGGGLLGLFGGGGGSSAGGFMNDAGYMEYAGSLGFATGGVALPGSRHRVLERGPELLDVNGQSFLMMGSQRGRVKPLSNGGGGDIYNVQVTATPGMSGQQAMNQGRNIQRGMQTQLGRRSKDS